MGHLVDALLEEAPEAQRPPGPVPAEAEAIIASHIAAGRAAWPHVRVDDAEFARFLARRVGAGDDLVEELRELPAADLYLACACAAGDTRAIAAFETAYFANVDTAVVAMRAPIGAADEVKQILRTRFFVPTNGRPPAIADFGGRGNLHGWVRVSAARELLRLFKKERRKVELSEALLDEIAPFPDPETAAVKAKCRTELAAAFRAALAALSPRDRTLLRYQIADGLGIDAIGAIFRVHRATVARWLAAIRERLVADTQERLGATLRLDAGEVRSVIRLVRSQLDFSLVSLLAGDDTGAP
jgi:RNA polymerase sigma-70 factor, ECF subfamily